MFKSGTPHIFTGLSIDNERKWQHLVHILKVGQRDSTHIQNSLLYEASELSARYEQWSTNLGASFCPENRLSLHSRLRDLRHTMELRSSIYELLSLLNVLLCIVCPILDERLRTNIGLEESFELALSQVDKATADSLAGTIRRVSKNRISSLQGQSVGTLVYIMKLTLDNLFLLMVDVRDEMQRKRHMASAGRLKGLE
ncbi:hypothetical protein BJ508DRAFT_304379 [Ascobolus immersus RN42]|uniref:Uncharacterized protein n=1 Tax=Ascobolus immersus RN42 TaxID=1160509 RepID=A0A3N4IQJ1_ASCIM|nr:hypothetical protein BJ508DRAFT_304379 [Ascobolus immersus RN42]